ncbi:MAG: cytochrome c [Candidatus Acidiferrales bacterium]
MKRVSCVVLFLTFIVSPAVFANGAADASAGKDVFSKHCVACHGADGKGNDAVAKMMKVPIPPLGSKEVQALSDADLSKVITEGKGKMPAVKTLSSAEVANVVAFIRSIAQK